VMRPPPRSGSLHHRHPPASQARDDRHRSCHHHHCPRSSSGLPQISSIGAESLALLHAQLLLNRRHSPVVAIRGPEQDHPRSYFHGQPAHGGDRRRQRLQLSPGQRAFSDSQLAQRRRG